MTTELGSNPSSVVIGDIDGDGKPDLSVVNQGANTLSVLRNTSTSGSITTGSFAAKVDFATGTTPQIVAIGDLDGDGKLDLAVGNFGANTVSVLRNTSTSGSISVSSFATQVTFATSTQPIAVAIGDLDGDGKLDLATANYGANTISVFRNISSSGSITSGSFSSKIDFTTGTNPYYITIGDLDGDGKLDMAVPNYGTNTVSVLLNTSTSGSITTGSFASKVDFTVGSGPNAIAISDLDGDGKLDLAVTRGSYTTVAILRNTSTIGNIRTPDFIS